MVKAQIHAGGRGKGKFKDAGAGDKGGVRLAKSFEEVERFAGEMLGKTLVTIQTGPAGRVVKRLHRGWLADRARALSLGARRPRHPRIAFIASTEGGMDIEEVAHETPEKISRIRSIRHRLLSLPGAADRLRAGPQGRSVNQCGRMVTGLYRLRREGHEPARDQPARGTKDGELLRLDAKMNFDDNALYRHKDIGACATSPRRIPTEVEASKYDLSYVKLDGDIGCMVNGAGLAMATMDIIKLYGGEPGQLPRRRRRRVEEKVQAAFKIILSDPKVKGILVNIFGGIMRCDIIAEGVVAAAKRGGDRGAAGRAARGHQRRARQEDPGRLRPRRSSRPTTSATPPRSPTRCGLAAPVG